MTRKKRKVERNPEYLRVYLKQNVLEAAKERIRWVFDEFPNVLVNTSGGKDSTVIYHLALEVAREKGRLPLRVLFIDQEAEWQATIDTVRQQLYNPDVEPMWFQMPMRLFNATSTVDHWLECWDPNEEHRWMRPKEPGAYTENRYGSDRFAELFTRIPRVEFPDTPTAYLAGVRTEESPARFMAITGDPVWKGRTWGKILTRAMNHYTFYPIYDWNYTDVWKAIHDHDWPYNRIYDYQYRYGIPVNQMRVSNVHHETAVHSLFYMQEVEPDTYERLTQRIAGIDMAGKLGKADYFVRDLPFMFSSWREYRDYLLDKLITDPDWKNRFERQFDSMDRRLGGYGVDDRMHRAQINSILTNDWEFVKLRMFEKVGAGLNAKKAGQAAKARREAEA